MSFWYSKKPLKEKTDNKTVEKEVIKKTVIKEDKQIGKNYTEEYLNGLTFSEVKEIGKQFNTTDRSKTNLIKEILRLQK